MEGGGRGGGRARRKGAAEGCGRLWKAVEGCGRLWNAREDALRLGAKGLLGVGVDEAAEAVVRLLELDDGGALVGAELLPELHVAERLAGGQLRRRERCGGQREG